MSLFNIKTPSKAQSFLMLAMIDAATGLFAIIKPTSDSIMTIQNLLILPGWYTILELNSLPLTMREDSIVSYV
jgi:hypothetical protein